MLLLKDLIHGHIHINELVNTKKSKDHNDVAESYFLNSIKKNIDFFLFSKQKCLKKTC